MVTQGADVLRCSNGTFEDTFDDVTEDVSKLMTCSEPNAGMNRTGKVGDS